MKGLLGYVVRNLGEHRGAARLWLEGPVPARAGFAPGVRYRIDAGGSQVVLSVREDGDRVVSRKQKGDDILPVIDINSKDLLAAFSGMKAVRIVVRPGEIHVLPLASEVKRRKRLDAVRALFAAKAPLSVGSFAHGGGILCKALHDGVADAGEASRLAFAVEIREDMMEFAAGRNPAWDGDAIYVAAPMQEFAFDPYAASKLPETTILNGGIPCAAASKAGRSKKANWDAPPEADPTVGHLVPAIVALVAKANPAAIVLECVPEYQNSASGHVLRNVLREMGYAVHERLVNGLEFNALENRTRWAMVAVTEGVPFDLAALPVPERAPRRLSEILDDVPADASCWGEKAYLFAKEERDRAKGNGFSVPILTPESESVPVLRKGYHKGGSTDALLASPEGGRYRLLTPAEHAKAKGVDPALVEGLTSTFAHEMLGQSVIPEPFRRIGRMLAEALRDWAAKSADHAASPRGFAVCG